MARPVWTNEIIGDINDDFDPQYDIEVYGETALSGAKLILKNTITQAGTKHNADNMNNLFDFDNLDSMRGNYKATVFGSNDITEQIINIDTDIINATRVTTFSGNNIKEITTIYTDDGVHVLRTSTIDTIFEANGNVREEVS